MLLRNAVCHGNQLFECILEDGERVWRVTRGETDEGKVMVALVDGVEDPGHLSLWEVMQAESIWLAVWNVLGEMMGGSPCTLRINAFIVFRIIDNWSDVRACSSVLRGRNGMRMVLASWIL